MEKFVEELSFGDFFEFENKKYLLTSDFKRDGQRLCIDIDNGGARWLKPDCHINAISLYIMDANNNFMPLKEIKSDVPNQVKDIP